MLCILIVVCSQSEDIPRLAESPVSPPSLIHQPTITPSNPFDRLKNHTTMATLNSIIVPWLIAEFGVDYADWDNQKTATAMIAHVIVTEQLGGYTERTFPAIIDGYRVQQVAFTKTILQQVGNFCDLLIEIILPVISFQFSQPRPTSSTAMIFANISSSCFALPVKSKIASRLSLQTLLVFRK